ncbi:hypothetical protein [Terasakiella pusilla]|uniref:hypothetical protein n=1 Tax=Terasakiella pusilla TaxID=64973 RepID=UPI003AA7B7FD
MGDLIDFTKCNSGKQNVPPIARAILIESLEELQEAMSETLGYAQLVVDYNESLRACMTNLWNFNSLSCQGPRYMSCMH